MSSQSKVIPSSCWQCSFSLESSRGAESCLGEPPPLVTADYECTEQLVWNQGITRGVLNFFFFN